MIELDLRSPAETEDWTDYIRSVAMSDLDYVALRVGLRPPRVAVVFDASSAGWAYFGRKAVWQASQIWGGSGFIYVPHEDGGLSEGLLRAVREYDPDFVVVSAPTVGELLTVDPAFAAENSSVGEAQHGVELFARLEPTRQLVINACTPYRRVEDWGATGATQWDELQASIPPQSNTGPLTTAASVSEPQYCLSTPSNLGGPMGLASGAVTGMIQPPLVEVDSAPLDEDDATRVAEWLMTGSSHADLPVAFADNPAGSALSVNPASLVPAWRFAEGSTRRVSFGRGYPREAVVVGDGPADFALAVILDRLWGRALWVHSDWDPVPAHDPAGGEMTTLQARLFCTDRAFVITSATRDLSELDSHVSHLQSQEAASHHAAGSSNALPSRIIPRASDQLPWATTRRSHLAVSDAFDVPFALPARLADDGSADMITQLPTVLPRNGPLAQLPRPIWHVDVVFEERITPSGRGLDGAAVIVPNPNAYETWARSSGGGISFQAESFGWVGANYTLEQSITRPLLRSLGLRAWMSAISAQSGFRIQTSDAGHRTRILSELCGSRERLAEHLWGPLWGLFEGFLPSGRSTRTAYPNGGGVFLAGIGGLLNYPGIQAFSPELSGVQLRGAVDDLVSARALRRGLVLRCGTCRHIEFFAVDRLRQSNKCQRCDALTDLDVTAWGKPDDEPTWFYDLHEVARTLIAENGHAVLWFDQYLRTRSTRYLSECETDLCLASTGAKRAENDLVAFADGEVLVAEVKTSDSLGGTAAARRTAAEKRVLSAQTLLADEVILASTQTWQPSSVAAMKAAMAAASWSPGRRPRLRIVEEFRTAAVSDRVETY